MAVEAGVDFAVRERIINHWVKMARAEHEDMMVRDTAPTVWPPFGGAYEEVARKHGTSFADALLHVMDLMKDEPEVAVHLVWLVGRHVNDPHDWDNISTVVDLLKWRRDGVR